MSKRISDYNLVLFNRDDSTPLKRQIEEGWQPFHAPVQCSSNNSMLVQAMVKYADVAPEPSRDLDILIGEHIDQFRADLLARRTAGWELEGPISAQGGEPKFFAVITRRRISP